MRALAILALLSAPAFAGPLRGVRAINGGALCAVRDTGEIVCDKETNLPPAAVAARDFVPAVHPIIVRSDGSVVRLHLGETKLEPVAVKFKVKSAGLVGEVSELCVVGEKGELACGHFDVYGKDAIELSRVEGTFVDVQFSGKDLWAVDDRGALWCRGPSNCARTAAAAQAAPQAGLVALRQAYPSVTDVPAEAPLTRISSNVHRIYASGDPCVEVSADPKALLCWGLFKPVPMTRPTADELITAGDRVCARTRDKIQCQGIYDRTKSSTLTVKDAAKMHYGWGQFCVSTKTGALHCGDINSLSSLQAVTWASRAKKP